MYHALIGVLDRLARDHAIPMVAIVSVAIIAFAVVDIDAQLRAAAELDRSRSATMAVLAAEEVAAQAVVDDITRPRSYTSSWDFWVNVVPATSGPRALELQIGVLGREMRFACEVLAGAAPVCFARPLTTRSEVPAWVTSVTWHGGEVPALSAVVTGPLPPEVVVDSEFALLQLPTGTDRADYVLRREASRFRVVSGRGGVKVIPGNLWIPPGDGPFTLVLDVPMTVHVAGNIYLGRAIRVEGPGTLTLTAGLLASAPNPAPPIEGEGHLHLGLPRAEPSPAGDDAGIEVGAHLVVRGDCVARTPRVRLHGALALGGGFQQAGPNASVELTGLRLVNVDRIRIPGFATEGSPRPGRLRHLPQRAPRPPGERQKTLSLAGDGR